MTKGSNIVSYDNIADFVENSNKYCSHNTKLTAYDEYLDSPELRSSVGFLVKFPGQLKKEDAFL